MTRTTEMNEIVEERYQFCIWLYRIKKETDKRNKLKREQGEENLVYVDIFAKPCHIKKLFGPFLKTPQYTQIMSLEGHSASVVDLTLHENKLFSGSNDKTIRVWNIETYEEIATLEGHTSNVDCLTLHENKLYSGSEDTTIRIWNTKTYEEIATLRGHTDRVSCLTLHENKLVSGSEDNTIRIWNTETYEEIATLRGHTNSVFCLTLHENKLFSGSMDDTIRIWNTETYEMYSDFGRAYFFFVCLTHLREQIVFWE